MKRLLLLLLAAVGVSSAPAATEQDLRSFFPVLSGKKDPPREWINDVTSYGISADGKYSLFRSSGFGLAPSEVSLSSRLYFKSIKSGNFTCWDPGKLGIAFASTYSYLVVAVSRNCRYSLIWLNSYFSTPLLYRWDAFSNRTVDFGAVFPDLLNSYPNGAFLSDDGNRLTWKTVEGIHVNDFDTATKRLIPPSKIPGSATYRWIHPSANGQYLVTESAFGSEGALYRIRLSDEQVTLIHQAGGIPGGISDDGRYFAGIVKGLPDFPVYQMRRFDVDVGSSIPVAKRPDGPEHLFDQTSYPILSPNGRWAGFTSNNPDLSGIENRIDQYVKDLQTGNLVRVTASGPTAGLGSNCIMGVANNGSCVFSTLSQRSAMQFVVGGVPGPLASPLKYNASAYSSYSRPDGMSADGRYVATLEPEGVFVLDRVSQTRVLLPNTQSGFYTPTELLPVVSADGQYVFAFETSPSVTLKRYRMGSTEAESTGMYRPLYAVSSDGNIVLGGSSPVVWKNLTTLEQRTIYSGPADMDPTGRYVFWVDNANMASIIFRDTDMQTGTSRLISTTSMAQSQVDKVFVSGNGLRYIVSGRNGRTYVYNRITGGRLLALNGFYDILAVSHDGSQTVVCEGTLSNSVPRQRVIGAETSVGLITSTRDYGSPLTHRTGPPILVMDKPDMKVGPVMSLITAWER
jgi:hypothetical protein